MTSALSVLNTYARIACTDWSTSRLSAHIQGHDAQGRGHRWARTHSLGKLTEQQTSKGMHVWNREESNAPLAVEQRAHEHGVSAPSQQVLEVALVRGPAPTRCTLPLPMPVMKQPTCVRTRMPRRTHTGGHTAT